MKLLILLYGFLVSSWMFAQPQHQNWDFGSHVGVSFASGNPVLTPGSQIETMESCYTQSDASGNRMFYTDGLNVWDATNNLMPNGTGLFGNISSQCVVVPKPGNPNNFYVIVTDASFDPDYHGLTYSEIDMTLNGGMGDVIASVKNVQLNLENGEWISAVPHANCVDTWIITHGHSSNSNFLAYLVTSSGISSTPVVTDLGIDVDFNQIVGIMKPNPTGDKIVMTRPTPNAEVFLFDFDKSTGMITNNTVLSSGTFSDACYGIEFSRSGENLYIGQFLPPRIFQFDMTASNIAGTRTQVGAPTFSGEVGQLQIAPNDKIYVSYNVFAAAANFIGVINSPETTGAGCGFVQNGFNLAAGSSVYGLPWYYNPQLPDVSAPNPNLGIDKALCENTSVLLDPIASGSDYSYLWSDGSTDSTLTTTIPGTYWVQVSVGGCTEATDSIVVTLDTAEIGFELSDSVGCSPLSVNFSSNGSTGVFQWLWSLGDGNFSESENTSHTYSAAGVYDITLSAVSAAGCDLDTTLTNAITVYGSPVAEFSFSPSVPELDQEIQFQDESVGAIEEWTWTVGAVEFSNLQNPTYSTSQAASFVVTLHVVDTNECEDSYAQTISFQSEDLLYVPNSFTPNGDGINDGFAPSDVFGIIHTFDIYNRWGEVIWSAENGNSVWDGTYNGQLVPDGVYTWQISVMIGEIVTKRFEGHVTLIR